MRHTSVGPQPDTERAEHDIYPTKIVFTKSVQDYPERDPTPLRLEIQPGPLDNSQMAQLQEIEIKIRTNFIRKVYGILTFQLLLTIGFVIGFHYGGVTDYFKEGNGFSALVAALFWISIA